MQQLTLRERRSAGLQSEPGETLEHDAGERVEIADEESEEADVERLLDEPGDHVFFRRQRPEQASERDIDCDQRRGQEGHVAIDEAEA